MACVKLRVQVSKSCRWFVTIQFTKMSVWFSMNIFTRFPCVLLVYWIKLYMLITISAFRRFPWLIFLELSLDGVSHTIIHSAKVFHQYFCFKFPKKFPMVFAPEFRSWGIFHQLRNSGLGGFFQKRSGIPE